MSAFREFEILDWDEITSTFEIPNFESITEWDREVIMNRINRWVTMFGREYVYNKKDLFRHSIVDFVQEYS